MAEREPHLPDPDRIAEILTAPVREGMFPAGDWSETEIRELLATVGALAAPEIDWARVLLTAERTQIQSLCCELREIAGQISAKCPELFPSSR